MKKLIYAALVGSLALAVSARAADENEPPKKARKGRAASTAQTASSKGKGTARANVHRNSNATHNDAAISRQRNLNETAVQQKTAKKGLQNSNVDRSQNLTVNRRRNVTVINNWSGSRFSGQQYTVFRNYHRQRHDRNWWTSHYTRIVFFGGGGYYWNDGYWYPAWGYNPGYNYAYDGPIYGYNNLPPDQVVVNVQTRLQRNGYYSGPIDGSLGPMTRQAIAGFQADHGLAVTSAVDQPTLATLGLV